MRENRNVKYINGYLNYTGSKFKLLFQLLESFDYTKPYFVDLFSGSMVVSANVVDKYEKILINDILSDVIGIHKGVLNSDTFIENTKKMCPSKVDSDAYNELRNSYNRDKTPEKLWALILSCNSNFMRFNLDGDFNQSWGRRSWNKNTDKKVQEFIDYVRPYKNKIYFTSEDFSNIKINNPSFIYVDPPYGFCEDDDGNIINKQISEAGYNVVYKMNMDVKLYKYLLNLDKTGSTFMLSGLLEHNNKKSWLMSQLIRDGFKYKEMNFDYNHVSKKGKKESKEIIIMNY